MSIMSFLLRRMCAKNDRKRDQNLTPPEHITIHQDIHYGPHKCHVLDVYHPAIQSPGETFPVIVSVHGGAWVYGDKECYRPYCMDLARRGFAVVNFTYRLSPKYRFPCHLEDTVRAFDWTLACGAQYAMDLSRVFAVGDSAGGHLLALYCDLCVNPAYASTYAFSAPQGLLPKAVALNCGAYDLITAKDTAADAIKLMKDVLGHQATDEELRAISPAYHVATGFPPSYILTSNDDFLKDQPAPMMQALDEQGIPYEYHCFGDEETKLGHVFHLDIRHPQAIACNDAQCAFFRSQIQE